jgi:DNA-binding FrmR family transcriptional regulator
MVDSEMFSALRVRGRLEDIARTIAEARVTGDVYASLDAVEHALLAVMDEVAEIAQAVADTQVRVERDNGRLGGWMRRFTPFRSGDMA